MGISFKVSRNGTRFRPKPFQSEATAEEDVPDSSKESSRILGNNESTSASTRKLEVNITEEDEDISDNEVSFTLKLFPDGYSIGRPLENETGRQATLQDVSKFLHPYDRTSETLFSAIESGRLPGDILDDIPCKYVDGTLVCEVRDYRKCSSEPALTGSSSEGTPAVHKVRLRMSLENVVKDIPVISDSSWTYGDLMEVESRILKALQPQLCLDPTPKLDRLCDNPVPIKLNLDLCSLRRKRQRQLPEIAVTSNNKIHGKMVCIDRVPESSNCRLGDTGSISGNVMPQHVHENLVSQNTGPSNASNVLGPSAKSFVSDALVPLLPLVSHQPKYQMAVGNPRIMQDHGSGPVSNVPRASPTGQDNFISYTENLNSGVSSALGKRENQDVSPLSSLNKRARHSSVAPDGNPQQLMGPQMDNFNGSDSHWKNTLLPPHSIARGIPYANTGMQKYPQQMFEGGLSQEAGASQFTMGQHGMRYPKEEPVETERLDKPELNQNKNEMLMVEAERNTMDLQSSRLQQRLSQSAFMRSNFPQTPWNNLVQPLDNNSRKDDQFHKKITVQSPRVSTGGLPQSPLSSKSGEFSSGSIGPQFGPVATSALGSSKKEKSAVTSVPAVGGTTSLTSSANDSMQRQHQPQLAAKRRTNSLPRTPAMSGVGSPASVSNMSIPLNSSSPPVGTPPLAEQIMLDRFSKIEMVTARHQINCRKGKADEHLVHKPTTYPVQQLSLYLSNDSNSENFRDETCTMPLSKSIVGGSMNVYKTRVLNFVQTERILQGNGFSIVPKARTRMIMTDRPSDGSIAVHYGDIDDTEFLAAEDYLPTLPNAHIADLLAAQLCKLMARDGYHVEDHIQPKPIRTNRPSSTQSNVPGISQNNAAVEMRQYSDAVSGQPSNEVAKPTNSGTTSLNPTQNLPSTRMLPPGNSQSLQISQGLLPGVSMPARSQQPDAQPALPQQQQNQLPLIQQQPSQFQRSSLMLASSPLSQMNTVGQNSNMSLGNHMVNKTSALQLQLLQQHQQQQPPPQMQRKMMMGLGAMGMGNMGNNMVGLGGLGNVMGMGGPRGLGGTGISTPIGQISGMGGVAQNPMNLSQATSISNAIRSGQLTQQQAQTIMSARLRMPQSRTNTLGGPQSGLGGISGARQMHPGSAGLSMLGHSLNRGNINPMQRTAVGQMGPPKMMSGMNPYMNQQQPQQQQQQQLPLQQPQMQQQLQQQQQQMQPQQFQQQQQQQQQQETTSPLQAVLSPQQVGSPSTMGIPQQLNQQQQQQQQASPQQMSQRTPMSPQVSSGAMHPLSTGNPEACPASPQLSSQTLGSVGSITNSPMDLQGVNKSNSVSNA